MQPILPVYNTFDLTFVRGEGVYLFDDHNKKYVDFSCGYGVNALGHCHPGAVAALKDQADKVWHISNMFHHPLKEKLAARITAASFANTVFFTNSGAEAWELGLKMTRRYFASIGKPEKYRMICIENAFHGRTVGAISAAPKDYMIKGFGPLLEGFDIVPFNDAAALEKAITSETAAICLETVQGEGGIRPHSQEYINQLVALAKKHDLLIFLDEVQCGMGRTGTLFAYEHYGFMPDILCTAKGIGTGFPLGALLATERVAQYMTAGSHGTTYGGNPLAMAVGNAVLDVMLADGFMETVSARGVYMAEALHGLIAQFPKLYREQRGMGLMQGVQCQSGIDNRALIDVMHHEGVISIPAGDNVVRILPPLIISEREIDEGITAMHHASQKFMEKI